MGASYPPLAGIQPVLVGTDFTGVPTGVGSLMTEASRSFFAVVSHEFLSIGYP